MRLRQLLSAAGLVLALVVGLAAFRFFPGPAETSSSDPAPTAPVANARETAGAPVPAAAPEDAMATAARHRDLEALRDALRAAGVSDHAVFVVLATLIRDRYDSRFRDAHNEAIWWKGQSETGAAEAELEALREEIRRETTRIAGPEPSERKLMYSFLPDKKQDALAKIHDDYRQLHRELNRESGGFRSPATQERFRLLQEEERRDIAALLTPEELRELDLRRSPTARLLYSRMTAMDATEQEYRAIFDFEFALANAAPEEKAAMTKMLEPALKAALGESRHEEYVLLEDHRFSNLSRYARHHRLPANAARELFRLEQEAPAAAARVADDPALTLEQKKAALKNLAAENRGRMRALIGDEAAADLEGAIGMGWLGQLERGLVPAANGGARPLR